MKKRCLTPAEMLASQCIPTSSAQSRASGSPKLKMNEASPAALAKAAGNGMSVPCVGAFIIASIMCIDPVPWNSLLLKRCVLIQIKVDKNCDSTINSVQIDCNISTSLEKDSMLLQKPKALRWSLQNAMPASSWKFKCLPASHFVRFGFSCWESYG